MQGLKDDADAVRHFRFPQKIISAIPYGHGHINKTYLLTDEAGERYILQRINKNAFPDPPAVMENIAGVTAHLRAAFAARGEDPQRRVPHLLPALDGRYWYRDANLEYWRVYGFIPRTRVFRRTDNPAIFAAAGSAFGLFCRMLEDYPTNTLHTTVPRFHDTPHRMAQLDAAVAADACGRVHAVRRELAEAYAFRDVCATLTDMCEAGVLPLRVTHNDTKLSNVLFDEASDTALCVVDLDTVMPGLIACDFGDAIRAGANAADAEEKELSKVALRLDMYEAFAQAYLYALKPVLTAAEAEALPMGALLMTLECGLRYLTDYISGDVYFQPAWDGQNLQKARVQLRLALDMQKKRDDMLRITSRLI
ncbi:MAG: aminoglycoside phosphotransferase family protein [Eubacteriales bacterium]|nr:aminoglycoside phosphotransferase family protein [Eubacteriales bacterium]